MLDKAISQVTVIDCQCGVPEDVVKEVRALWKYHSYGNDKYFYRFYGEDAEDYREEYPALVKYLESNQIGDCLIRWWW